MSHDRLRAVIVALGVLLQAAAVVAGTRRVTVISRSDPVFPTADPLFGRAIGDELRRNKVVAIEGCTVESLESAGVGA